MDVEGAPRDAARARQQEQAWAAQSSLGCRPGHDNTDRGPAERGKPQPSRAHRRVLEGPTAAGAGGQTAGTPGEDEHDAALRLRLDRVVALAGRRQGRGRHAELLEELRALVRQAEGARPPAEAPRKEVAERPARRLHGT